MNIAEDTSASEELPRAFAVGSSLLIIVNYLAWIPYTIVFIALLRSHPTWVLEFIRPLARMNSFAWLASIPFLLLVYIPRTRAVGGLGFVLLSSLFTVTLSCYCALVVYENWGKIGLVGGTFFVGYGIIPAAIVSNFFAHQWSLFFQNIVSLIVIGLAKYSGHTVAASSIEADLDEVEAAGKRGVLLLSIVGCTCVVLIGMILFAIGYYHPELLDA